MPANLFDNLQVWRLVEELFRRGEITAAANAVGMDPPKASRKLAALEAEIGFPLFDRSTRPFRLTKEAAQVQNLVRMMLNNARHLQNGCKSIHKRGTQFEVRMGVATDSCPGFLLECLDEYRRINPDLDVRLSDSACVEDLENGRLHVAYLPCTTGGNTLLDVPVTTSFTLAAASPGYIARFGAPRSPEDLAGHTVLARREPGYPACPGLWRHSVFQPIRPRRQIAVGNHMALAACRAARGVALDLPAAILVEEIEAGRLVPVLDGWHRPCWHLTLACRKDTLYEASAIGHFLDWLCFRLQPWENAVWQKLYAIAGVTSPLETERISLETLVSEDGPA